MHVLMSCTISKYVAYNPPHHITQYWVFQSSQVYRCRTFPNLIHPRDFLCMFISNGLTSPKWSPAWPTQKLKLPRVQVHRVTRERKRDNVVYWKTKRKIKDDLQYIFYLVEDGSLCRHRIRAKRVIFDNLVHFNFIVIMYNFFFLSLSSVMVSYRGSPGYICLWKISMWLFAQVFHEVWRHSENL